MKERTEVIKHSAAIHIQNNISLLQRRAWNVLLAYAYDELPTEEKHQIRIKDLSQVLEFESKNEVYLKDALEALVGCKVKWNILDKDKEMEWGVATLLAQAVVKQGVCSYAYAPIMRERLHNPRMYARICLRMQNKFNSKYAQALWEICADYFDTARNFGETPFLPLTEYRALMGVDDSTYPEFKEFNKFVIKVACREVNEVTDFHVEQEYKRERRKVTAVKFRVRRTLEMPHIQQQQPLFPEYEDAPGVYELQHAGFSPDEAWRIWQQGFEFVSPGKRPQGVDWDTYLYEKIDLLRRRKASGEVKSSTGFLLKAITENYANPEFTEAQAAKQQAEKKRAKGRKQQTLEGEQMQLEKARRSAVHEICQGLIDAEPELVEMAAEALLASDADFPKLYKSTESALQNYQSGSFLRTYFQRYFEQQRPELFAALRSTYDVRLAVINKELQGLEKAAV